MSERGITKRRKMHATGYSASMSDEKVMKMTMTILRFKSNKDMRARNLGGLLRFHACG